VSKKVSASFLWQFPHWLIMSRRKSDPSVREIWCEVWQSSQTGSLPLAFVFPLPWMEAWKTSPMPWWHLLQVWTRLARLTVERGSAGGSSPCGVWQSAQVAVTTRPASSRPTPWIDSR
jgi:hypothetical protein